MNLKGVEGASILRRGIGQRHGPGQGADRESQAQGVTVLVSHTRVWRGIEVVNDRVRAVEDNAQAGRYQDASVATVFGRRWSGAWLASPPLTPMQQPVRCDSPVPNWRPDRAQSA